MTDPNTFNETAHRPDEREDQDVDTPSARQVRPLGDDKHDHLAEKTDAEDRQEALLDEGVEETFPASDPVSAKRIT